MPSPPCPVQRGRGGMGHPQGKWEKACHVPTEGIALQSTPQGTHITWGGPYSTFYSPQAPKPEGMTHQGYGVKLSLASKPVLSQAPKHGAAPVFWSPRGPQSPDPWLTTGITQHC